MPSLPDSGAPDEPPVTAPPADDWRDLIAASELEISFPAYFRIWDRARAMAEIGHYAETLLLHAVEVARQDPTAAAAALALAHDYLTDPHRLPRLDPTALRALLDQVTRACWAEHPARRPRAWEV